MAEPLIRQLFHLDFQWQTVDPFLFCVHHDDRYPRGNDELGPAASLAGRQIGRDFEGLDGWRMYHGDVVPGFPRHPHRGFETITVARQGFIDHSDSLGATARYGHGDIQWMTAGQGIVHAEMFPLVRNDAENPCELFQIWMNLPAEHKMVPAYFKMLWAEAVPELTIRRPGGEQVHVRVMAGSLAVEGAPSELRAPPPTPHSWAADPANEVGIWSVALSPGARFTVPPASPGVNRTIYFFAGASMAIGGREVSPKVGVSVRPDVAAELVNGGAEAEVLILQGKPIGEPVAHYGPFVMNTRAELQQAFADYQRTQFGGWPWHRDDPVHDRVQGRFAKHPDGRIDKPVG